MGKRMVIIAIAILIGMVGWKLNELVKIHRENVLGTNTTKTLEERVASLESRVYTLEKNAGLVSSKSTKATESYMNLVGGDFSSTDWSKIPGSDFTLDTSLYGKTVEVSWQGWLSGQGSVRLFDATNHRAVDFSEFVANSDGNRSFYSKVMSIWRGQNQYYIEGKVVGGSTTLSSAKLKIVVK